MGAKGCLQKPINKNELSAIIAKLG